MHFTPEREAKLAQIANSAGTDAERLAPVRLLEEDAGVRAAGREGVTQADEGKFIEEADSDAGPERMLRTYWRIRWTPAAAADLEEISEYVKERASALRATDHPQTLSSDPLPERGAEPRTLGPGGRKERAPVSSAALHCHLSRKRTDREILASTNGARDRS